MAKKVLQLSFLDIVMGAEAETIKAAYEAKVRIDEQLALREEAYLQIAEIEEKIEDIVGEKGKFVFPAPPLPVAGISKPIESTKSTAKAKPVKPKAPAVSKVEKPDSEVSHDDTQTPVITEVTPEDSPSEQVES